MEDVQQAVLETLGGEKGGDKGRFGVRLSRGLILWKLLDEFDREGEGFGRK